MKLIKDALGFELYTDHHGCSIMQKLNFRQNALFAGVFVTHD